MERVNKELETLKHITDHLVLPMSTLSATSVSQNGDESSRVTHPLDSGIDSSIGNADITDEPEFTELLKTVEEADVSHVLKSDSRNVVSRIPRTSAAISRNYERTGYHREDHI